jgi:hypothetical protein
LGEANGGLKTGLALLEIRAGPEEVGEVLGHFDLPLGVVEGKVFRGQLGHNFLQRQLDQVLIMAAAVVENALG